MNGISVCTVIYKIKFCKYGKGFCRYYLTAVYYFLIFKNHYRLYLRCLLCLCRIYGIYIKYKVWYNNSVSR